MTTRMIRIFDTTLRDGEQSPGASMNVEEKVMVAKQLARLGVDIIEAGFAYSSPGDFGADAGGSVAPRHVICHLRWLCVVGPDGADVLVGGAGDGEEGHRETGSAFA